MQTHIITASPESLWSRWICPYWSSSNSTGRLTADWTQLELKRGKKTWHLVKMMLSMGRAILVSHCPCSSVNWSSCLHSGEPPDLSKFKTAPLWSIMKIYFNDHCHASSVNLNLHSYHSSPQHRCEWRLHQSSTFSRINFICHHVGRPLPPYLWLRNIWTTPKSRGPFMSMLNILSCWSHIAFPLKKPNYIGSSCWLDIASNPTTILKVLADGRLLLCCGERSHPLLYWNILRQDTTTHQRHRHHRFIS